MVKFITRTICMALVAVLCVGSLTAQNARKYSDFQENQEPQKTVEHSLSSFIENQHHSSMVFNKEETVLYESFDANIPSTWTNTDADGDGRKWKWEDANAQPVTSPYAGGGCVSSASWDNGTVLSPDNWLISPMIISGGEVTIQYWVAAQDPDYPNEHYAIFVSTSGTEPGDFTMVAGTEETLSTDTYLERNYNLGTYNGAIYVAFRHWNVSDVFVMKIDEVYIRYTEGETNDCPEVKNLAAAVQGTDVVVTWDAAEGTPSGYKVYLDAEEKATVSELTHKLSGVAGGKHTVSVAATYSDGCTPKKVTTPEFTVGNCDGVKNFAVAYNTDCGADLSWEEPAKTRGFEGWINYCINDEVTGRIGYDENAGEDMTMAIRFTSSEFSNYGITSGQLLTKVALGIGTDMNSVNTMEIKIWQGGNSITNPGTLIYTQPITNYTTFAESTMVEIELDEEIEIDVNQELRIGWRIVNTAGYPFGRDAGPAAAPGKADLFICPALNGGAWVSYNNTYGWQNNVSMKGFVVEGGPVELSYNVYRDGEKIAGPIKETTYTDPTFDTSVGHEWAVAVVCSNGADSKWESKDMEACDPPVPCDPPTNVKAENVGDGVCVIQLTWDGEGIFHATKDGEDLGAITSPYKDEAVEEGVTYNYCVYQVCDDEQSESVCAEATCPVGINDLKESVNIYPNPATSVVKIEGKDVAKVEVYNVVGQMVEKKVGEITTIDVSAFNSGIYLFRVYDSNNNVVTKRIMVTK